jgi:hypothetical protein
VCALLAVTACGSRSQQEPPPEAPVPVRSLPCPAPPEIWFADLGEPIAFGHAEAEAVLGEVRATVADQGRPLGALPEHLDADQEPRIVYVSAGDGQSRARVSRGAARGFRNALGGAVTDLRRLLRGREARWLRIDVVEDRERREPGELTPERFEDLFQNRDGLAGSGSHFLEELPGGIHVSRHRGVHPGLQLAEDYRCRFSREGPEPGLQLWRYNAASYFSDGTETLRLHLGHRERPALSPEVLLEAARAGGDYLRRSVSEDGTFAYSYLALIDEARRKYNMVRHAGTVYSMLELYEVTRDAELLAAAERALDYLLGFVEPWGDADQRARVLAYRRKIKLGGVALTVLALTKHVQATGSPRYRDVAQDLCRYIALSQRASGEFIHSRAHPSGKVRPFTSRYYPGEAILALLRMHAVDRDPAWLEVAERGARFLIEVRDRNLGISELDHDHWLLYALNELHRQRPSPAFLGHAMRIAQAIVAKQNRDPESGDHLGTYGTPPRSTPVATRSEGLLAALALARDFDVPEMAREIRRTVDLNTGFQLITQVGPERALFLDAPQTALGGFTRSLTNYEIRIDYVQHNISALLGLYRVLLAER